MKNFWFLWFVLVFVCAFALKGKCDNYSRTYNPTYGVSKIASSTTITGGVAQGLPAEFEAIELVINGNLDAGNVKNYSLLNEDFANDTITTAKIKDATLTPADFANINSILAGGMIYSTSSGVLGVLAKGTSGQYLQSNGSFPSWENPSTSGWTDTGAVLHPDSNDDNVVIGGTAAGTSSKAVLAIYNNTAPSDSVTNGVELYAEDVSNSSELKVRDEAGNVTTLSPHNFSLIPLSALDDAEFPFSYYSRNENIGREINVDMFGAIRQVEKLSGKKFIYLLKIPEKQLTEAEKKKLPEWEKYVIAKNKEKEGKVSKEI